MDSLGRRIFQLRHELTREEARRHAIGFTPDRGGGIAHNLELTWRILQRRLKALHCLSSGAGQTSSCAAGRGRSADQCAGDRARQRNAPARRVAGASDGSQNTAVSPTPVSIRDRVKAAPPCASLPTSPRRATATYARRSSYRCWSPSSVTRKLKPFTTNSSPKARTQAALRSRYAQAAP